MLPYRDVLQEAVSVGSQSAVHSESVVGAGERAADPLGWGRHGEIQHLTVTILQVGHALHSIPNQPIKISDRVCLRAQQVTKHPPS